MLIYGHYDVQPVDPLAEWHKPPFEPYIESEKIYARGATDDKGQVMVVLAALEAWAKVEEAPPVNIKILLEGEEEAGGAVSFGATTAAGTTTRAGGGMGGTGGGDVAGCGEARRRLRLLR